jgi:hypothetical protein
MCRPTQPTNTKSTNEATRSSVAVNCSRDTDEICKTVFEKPEKQVKLKDLPSDKEALKKSDPFMYFSIPTVRSEVLGMDAVGDATQESSFVTRKSRISVERHVNLVFEELFGELADVESETDRDSDEADDYLSFVFGSQ